MSRVCEVINAEAQQVNTPDGPIKGIAEKTVSGKTYYAYYSIPYAKPPIGSKRLQASEPIDQWTEVYDGSREKPNICFQLFGDSESETEDCLFLSIFTPKDPSSSDNSTLPVFVYIHGGGFIFGSGKTATGISPKYLVEEDVIVVSLNYRLGVFGFLSTGDDVIPGNAGLSDQIAALKWVKKNIAAFGGNPNQVTVAGQSAGAKSIGYLIISPAANGLFSAGIMESGTQLCAGGYQRNQTEITFKVGSFVDSQFESSTDSKKLLEVLQSADARTLANAAASFYNWLSQQPNYYEKYPVLHGYYFTPVIDSASSNPLLPELQYEAVASGKINKVPVFVGVCSEEGLMDAPYNNVTTLKVFDENPSYLNPQDMNISGEKAWREVGALIKQQYSPSSSFVDNPLGIIHVLPMSTWVELTNSKPVVDWLESPGIMQLRRDSIGNYSIPIILSHSGKSFSRLFSDRKLRSSRYFTDQEYARGSIKHAELQSAFTDVFYYQFSYTGQLGEGDKSYPGSGNVSHGGEINYIYAGKPLANYPENDQLTSKRLVKLWANFAKYKNPTPVKDELLQNIIWPNVAPGNFQYVNIGNYSDPLLTVIQGKPNADRMIFWDSVYDKYGHRPYDTY